MIMMVNNKSLNKTHMYLFYILDICIIYNPITEEK